MAEWLQGFFCTSALVDGQPQSMSSDSIPMCSSSSVTIVISPAVMQCGMCCVINIEFNNKVVVAYTTLLTVYLHVCI